MGLRFISRREIKQNNAEIAFLKDNASGALELTHWRDKKSITEGENFDHLAFETDDLDARIQELRTHGVTVAMEPFSLQGSSNKIAFVKDPDGNWIELIQEPR